MSKIYLGLDVHIASTVWYLVDDTGQVMGDGKVPTTEPGLEGVITRCQEQGGDGGRLGGASWHGAQHPLHHPLPTDAPKMHPFCLCCLWCPLLPQNSPKILVTH